MKIKKYSKQGYTVRKPFQYFLSALLILSASLLSHGAFADKPKKVNLPKSYESKLAPEEITDADRTFIELREAAKKNDVFRSQQ